MHPRHRAGQVDMVKRACNVDGCMLLSDGYGASKCPEHQAIVDARKGARHKARRKAVDGDGAASRLRRKINQSDSNWFCAYCARPAPASMLEVDHRTPLSNGGGDFDSNLQLLCRPCHKEKGTRESQARGKSAGHTPRGYGGTAL